MSPEEVKRVWTAARREHAFVLRCTGLTWREIGARLGVTAQRACQLATGFMRRAAREG